MRVKNISTLEEKLTRKRDGAKKRTRYYRATFSEEKSKAIKEKDALRKRM